MQWLWLNTLNTYPSTTDLRNFDALSTTSSQTVDTEFSSNSVASGNDLKCMRHDDSAVKFWQFSGQFYSRAQTCSLVLIFQQSGPHST